MDHIAYLCTDIRDEFVVKISEHYQLWYFGHGNRMPEEKQAERRYGRHTQYLKRGTGRLRLTRLLEMRRVTLREAGSNVADINEYYIETVPRNDDDFSQLIEEYEAKAASLNMSFKFEEIEKIQNECVRLIHGIRRGKGTSHKLVQTNWLNMKDRRVNVVFFSFVKYLNRKKKVIIV
nr:unnamed protein product [Callosobruchus analis]